MGRGAWGKEIMDGADWESGGCVSAVRGGFEKGEGRKEGRKEGGSSAVMVMFGFVFLEQIKNRGGGCVVQI